MNTFVTSFGDIYMEINPTIRNILIVSIYEGAMPEECSVQSTDKDKYQDKLGCLHFMKTTYGQAVLVLRVAKFTQSSGQTYANDLLPIFLAQVKDGKTVAFIKVDNGSDWNVRSPVNLLDLCCLWKTLVWMFLEW